MKNKSHIKNVRPASFQRFRPKIQQRSDLVCPIDIDVTLKGLHNGIDGEMVQFHIHLGYEGLDLFERDGGLAATMVTNQN